MPLRLGRRTTKGSESPWGVERTSWAFDLTAGRVVRRDCGARMAVVLVEKVDLVGTSARGASLRLFTMPDRKSVV